MSEREEGYDLCGKIQYDDDHLGEERSGGKAGSGSENKISFVAVMSLNKAGHPICTKITPVVGFTYEATAAWDQGRLKVGPLMPLRGNWYRFGSLGLTAGYARNLFCRSRSDPHRIT